MTRKVIVLLVLGASTTLGQQASDIKEKPKGSADKLETVEDKLKAVEDKLTASPDDPMLYYRKAQYLMTLGCHEAGFAAAEQAKELFIKTKQRLAWMRLERIDLGKIAIDVCMNLGPDERKPPKNGLIKPLSFHVWNTVRAGEDPALLDIIDYENGYFGGEVLTAAFGKMIKPGTYGNFGTFEPELSYPEIRQKFIELIKRTHNGISEPERSPCEEEAGAEEVDGP